MNFIETPIAGAYLLQLQPIADDRGWFGRGWCSRELGEHGLTGAMTQLNAAYTVREGTVRGLHYQLPPDDEAKLARCTKGRLFDVLVDLRAASPTRGRWAGYELTPENGLMLYVPEGCAHGYQTLAADTEMYYLTSKPYAPGSARGLRYDSAAVGIQWPLPVSVVSAADQAWPHTLPE
jgi:dTDP-4-dehydrorhamnose 3,5-epimerase